ncbi:MAG: toll/interleukin-1 receptor domain-containing protein [Oscillospiraceae bacterium]|jgi:hypothetical protein|nr:toll/interleukin-1 receptor domain-containing protein [Oscillospiraceae bacterium]
MPVGTVVDKPVFVSHSSENGEIAIAICEFLNRVGCPYANVFCTSMPPCKPRLNMPMEDLLKTARESATFAILSCCDEYQKSPDCIEETQHFKKNLNAKKIVCFFHPSFNFNTDHYKLSKLFGIELKKSKRVTLKSSMLDLADMLSRAKLIIKDDKAINWAIDKFVEDIERLVA